MTGNEEDGVSPANKLLLDALTARMDQMLNTRLEGFRQELQQQSDEFRHG